MRRFWMMGKIGGAIALVGVTLWSAGCAKPPVEPLPEFSSEVVLEAARARPIPDRLRARFTVKIHSEALDIAGTTGGGLVASRPGRNRVEIFGPMGGALLSVVSDGSALSVILAGPRKQLVSPDAERVVREATGGAAGLDDFFGLLVGDVPLDSATVAAVRTVEEGGHVFARIGLTGPGNTAFDVWLDPVQATPRRVQALDARGRSLLVATFDAFQSVGPAWLPTRVELYVPSVDLRVEARYRDWQVLDVAPEVFDTQPVPGLQVESLEDSLRSMLSKVRTQGG
jgi:hypothetical protein